MIAISEGRSAMTEVDGFLSEVSGVIHVGAHAGQERDLYASHGLTVLWVEANPTLYATLCANIATYPKQRALCALVTDRDGSEYQFNLANNMGGSSSIFPLGLHRNIWREIDYVGQLPLRSTTLDTLMHNNAIDPSDYQALVMDVQGAELLVLTGGASTLRHCRYVKAEAADFESYIGAAKLEDLDRHLLPLGFREVARQSFGRLSTGGKDYHYWDVTWKRDD